MKFNRLISILLIFVIALSVPYTAGAEIVTTVIACSDFQHPNGNESGAETVKELVNSLKSFGITSADGFLCCGDYNYGSGNTYEGINSLKSAVSDVVSQNMVFVRGNHDEQVSANVGLSKSGNNDTENYGVYVIHETDYMRTNSNESTIKKTAQYLINYLNEKLENGYTQPIFVVSHLPLHYTMRTRLDGDGKYANYIFDALNEAGQKGLNIIFMYGHDHSNGWDDYLGGAAVYLKKGDSILIAQGSQTEFLSKTLQFTYMNAGFVGYYNNHNGADDTLTMTSFEISSSRVEVARYNSISTHNLKSAGVTNSYKNESEYSPNTTVYASPQTITLTSVTDSTAIADIMDIPDPDKAEGERFGKITDIDELKDGGKYLIVYNTSSDYIMMPTVVTKSNGSTNRRGFDIKMHDDFGDDIWVDDNISQYVWTFKKADNGWYVGNGVQNAVFTETTDMSITATLENTGDIFTVSGSDGAFNFTSGEYTFNYNSRGLINGFAKNPAPFYIYEYVGHTVFVDDGSCTVKSAQIGDSVTITANPAPEGMVFDRWVYVTGTDFIDNVYSEQVTFIMPDSAVKIKATYKTDDNVVINSVTGKRYASLEEALDNANEGETIKLTANVSAQTLLVNPGVALDLSGYNLTVNRFVGFEDSDIFDSNTASKGGLYVAKNRLVLSKNNSQLPVYDAENGCYVFLKINLSRANKFVYSDGSYTAEPVFGDSATIAKGIAKTLFSQGADKSGANVRVRVSWVDKNGTYTATQDYTYTDAMVSTVVNSFTGSKYTTIFGASFSEAVLTQGDSIEISTIVDSGTGVELSSNTITINMAQ